MFAFDEHQGLVRGALCSRRLGIEPHATLPPTAFSLSVPRRSAAVAAAASCAHGGRAVHVGLRVPRGKAAHVGLRVPGAATRAQAGTPSAPRPAAAPGATLRAPRSSSTAAPTTPTEAGQPTLGSAYLEARRSTLDSAYLVSRRDRQQAPSARRLQHRLIGSARSSSSAASGTASSTSRARASSQPECSSDATRCARTAASASKRAPSGSSDEGCRPFPDLAQRLLAEPRAEPAAGHQEAAALPGRVRPATEAHCEERRLAVAEERRGMPRRRAGPLAEQSRRGVVPQAPRASPAPVVVLPRTVALRRELPALPGKADANGPLAAADRAPRARVRVWPARTGPVERHAR